MVSSVNYISQNTKGGNPEKSTPRIETLLLIRTPLLIVRPFINSRSLVLKPSTWETEKILSTTG